MYADIASLAVEIQHLQFNPHAEHAVHIGEQCQD